MSDPVILLTGASRGLGLAVLSLLLSRPATRVATLSRSVPPALADVAAAHADRVLVVQGDVGVEADNARLVARAVERWGRVDALVLNAGSLEPIGKLADLPTSSFIPYLQANLLSVLYLVQPALPHLRQARGRIVLVSSGAATGGYQAWGLYGLAKAGMNSLARTLANEERGVVDVWAVRPGLVDTDMQALIRSAGPGHMSATDMPKFIAAHESGQLLDPRAPGAVIAGLALAGPSEASGEFLNWEDERLAPYRI
ncbi:hypothetical protein Q5752_003108 [Cryptotrichosporon argae]